MTAAQMREKLVSRYPNQFYVPSETEIKHEIIVLNLLDQRILKGRKGIKGIKKIILFLLT